ncbi:MAG: DUF5069 domain-containing protein [Verrucomicrobia bacterium]|nr:DUF5069 domain-containing protein [Verrucomicrobiota bacterium]
MSDPWQKKFREVYDRGVAAWHAGRKSPATMFGADDVAYLATLGCTAQELFDFVDDSLRYGEPDFATTLEVSAIRRDYFLNVLHGQPAPREIAMDALPAKRAEADGIPWLPRIIAKARAKLRGEMPADLMYGCGGDRHFMQEINMTLPQFLTLVRDLGENDRAIIDAVKKSSGRA